MRRHLPWIAGVAAIAAIALLIALALRPPSVEAPTASGAGTATATTFPTRTSPSATASPTTEPTARVTPPPGSASLPPDAGPTPAGYRPPPDSFDGSSLAWAGDAVTGSSQEKRFGLWTAGIDGSDLREVLRGEIGTGQVVVASDRSVAFLGPAGPGGTAVFVAPPGGGVTEAVPSASEIKLGFGEFYALALGPGTANSGPIDAGVWSIPAAGGPATAVAPATNARACNVELFGERTRSGVAVSDSYVASALCIANGDGFRLAIELFDRAAGTARTIDVNARPLGFDAAGRLVAQSDAGFVSIDPASGTSTPLPGVASGQARVTPRGRWLVTYAGDTEVSALDLTSGTTARWDVGTPAAYDLTAFGDETRVVLESFAQFPAEDVLPGWHIVIDLEEGWLGYLPPIAPFRGDPPE